MSFKIVIAVNHFCPSIGGAEKVSKTIADYLCTKHNVSIFTRKLTNKNRNKKDFLYPIHEYTQGDIVYFEKKIQEINPDIVLVYSDVFDFFRMISSKKQSYQVILALCGANWLCSRRSYMNTLYRNANNIKSIICHSTRERDYKICSVDVLKDKISIIPNGVWLDEFDTNSKTRTDLAPNISEKRWIINVSNFFPGKGQEHLIKILSGLPKSELKQTAYIQICSDIDFEIGKVLEGRWKVFANKLQGTGIKVELKKNISRENVIGFLKQSNVFAFSSEKEVAPLVLLEAMAASLPWVSTNVGNAEDLQGGIYIRAIKDSRFHSVFDKHVELRFREAILKMWNTPSFGEDGRKQIEKELTWDKILPQYLYLIEK